MRLMVLPTFILFFCHLYLAFSKYPADSFLAKNASEFDTANPDRMKVLYTLLLSLVPVVHLLFSLFVLEFLINMADIVPLKITLFFVVIGFIYILTKQIFLLLNFKETFKNITIKINKYTILERGFSIMACVFYFFASFLLARVYYVA